MQVQTNEIIVFSVKLLKFFLQLARRASIPFLAVLAPLNLVAAEQRSYGYVPASEAELASFPKEKHYRAFLPESVDLSNHFPTPGDQKTLGSCVAWAVGYAARSYYAQSIEGRKRNNKKDIPSPSYIYNAIVEPKNCKDGTNFPAALRLLQGGSLSLADYPQTSQCKSVDKEQIAAASDFKIESFLRVDLKNIDDVKGAVARGQPVMFGMMVGSRFERLHKGQIYTATSSDKTPYGHAATLVGYDDRKQALKLINSWGANWGDNGFGWIAYDTFISRANEAYIMQVAQPAPQPKTVIVVTVPPAPDPEPKPAVAVPPPKTTVKPSVVVQPEPEVKPTVIVRPALPVLEDPVVPSDCSKVVSSRVGDKTVISGFVGTVASLEQVRKAHQELNIQIDVQVRPWPQCEVLMTLDGALASSDGPQLATKTGQTLFKKADQIALSVTAPRKPAYIYISYVQADGTVVNLEQPQKNASAPSLSVKEYHFGDGLEGRQKFVASAPFGREMVVVVASSSPLFDEKLPAEQTEREYLSLLRKAIIYKVDPKKPDREISAAFLGIETQEKQP